MAAADQPANASLSETTLECNIGNLLSLSTMGDAFVQQAICALKFLPTSLASCEAPFSNDQHVWLQAGGELGGWQRA